MLEITDNNYSADQEECVSARTSLDVLKAVIVTDV
jgi:hypothetical protein